MRMVILGLVGSVLVIVAYPICGVAEDFPVKSSVTDVGNFSVASGDYKPLTFWKSVSLGTSYFTDPQRAKAISVAYSFDGPEFSVARDALWELAKEGKISFGITDKEKTLISVVSLPELQKQFSIADADDLTRVLKLDNVSVVAVAKVLLGESSKSPVIKTDPPKSTQ